MKNNKELYSLEDINRQFERKIINKSSSKEKRKKGQWLNFAMIILVMIVLGGMILGIRLYM